MSCRHDLEGDGDSLDGPGAVDREGNRLPLPDLMKRQTQTLGESDPQGCLEAEARRTTACAHPPVAELHCLWCSDCNTESTDDGRVLNPS